MSAKKGEEAEEMQTNLQTNIINFADIEEGGGKNLKKMLCTSYMEAPLRVPSIPSSDFSSHGYSFGIS